MLRRIHLRASFDESAARAGVRTARAEAHAQLCRVCCHAATYMLLLMLSDVAGAARARASHDAQRARYAMLLRHCRTCCAMRRMRYARICATCRSMLPPRCRGGLLRSIIFIAAYATILIFSPLRCRCLRFRCYHYFRRWRRQMPRYSASHYAIIDAMPLLPRCCYACRCWRHAVCYAAFCALLLRALYALLAATRLMADDTGCC